MQKKKQTSKKPEIYDRHHNVKLKDIYTNTYILQDILIFSVTYIYLQPHCQMHVVLFMYVCMLGNVYS